MFNKLIASMAKNKISNNDSGPNSFGGGDAIIDILRKEGIIESIDEKLGPRSARAEYTYAEGIISLLISKCRGHKRIEDFYLAQNDLINHPRFQKGMSPDTFLYMCKEQALPNKYYPNISANSKAKTDKRKKPYIDHEVNVLGKYNELLVDTSLKLKLLNQEDNFTLDLDTTELRNKIQGSRRFFSGKGKKAYSPVAAMIDRIPVYVENRNGNTPASFNLVETLQNIFNLLSQKGIKVDILRIDAAGFVKEAFTFAQNRNFNLIVRAKSNVVKKEKEFINNWRETTIKGKKQIVGSTTFRFGNNELRLVVKKVSKPIIDEDGEETKYWGLATNDFDKTDEEIIEKYELRGDSENLFRGLNQMGWKMMPLRKFEHNTVYLYMTALNSILYRFLNDFLYEKVSCITKSMRFDSFIKKFMPVTTSWINGKLQFLKRTAEFEGLSDFLVFESG